MTTPVVRAARRDEVDVVAALEAQTLGADAWSPGLVRAGILGDLPTVRYLVAVDADGTAVGHAVASLVADVAELQRIGVSPDVRRSGVASALLDAVLAEARAVGATRVLLEVRLDNAAARAFYGARGFTAIGERRSYYADGATAVVMERPLTEPADPSGTCGG